MTKHHLMIPAGPLYHKPKSIIAARNILYASLFLALISYLIPVFVLNLPGHPNIFSLISNGVLLILLYIAIRFIGFGKKWARILCLVLFVINVATTLVYLPYILKTDLALDFLFVLQMLLQILALVYLFSKSSNVWFNSFKSV